MHPAFEIEPKMRAYLERRLPLKDAEAWFRLNRAVLLSLPPEIKPSEIATMFELGMIEMNKGNFSERQFRSALRQVLGTSINVVVEDSDKDLSTTGAVTTQLSSSGAAHTPSLSFSFQLTPTGTSS